MPETDPNAPEQTAPPADPPAPDVPEQTDVPDPVVPDPDYVEPDNLPAPEQAGDYRTSDEYLPDVPGSAPHSPEPLETIAEEVIIYPADGRMKETAQALLAATDDPLEVKYIEGTFVVPKDVAERAQLPEDDKTGPELESNAPKGNQRGPKVNRAKS